MGNQIRLFSLVIVLFCSSCSDRSTENRNMTDEGPIKALPFETIGLEDLKGFRSASENWTIAGDVYADRTKNRILKPVSGTGHRP
jgi:hypothetical protein